MVMAAEWVQMAMWAVVVLLVWSKCVSWAERFWWRPKELSRKIAAQGFQGPRPRFLLGNAREVTDMMAQAAAEDMPKLQHDIGSRVLPHLYQWTQLYGKQFLYWVGPVPRISITEMQMVKAVVSNHHAFPKPESSKAFTKDVIGTGLVFVNGEEWRRRRRVVTPAFHVEKLKGMLATMVKSSLELLAQWEEKIKSSNNNSMEIEVHWELTVLTADIISKTGFGSSYEQGKRLFAIFSSILEFPHINALLLLPGYRLLPTRRNREVKQLRTELVDILQGIIQARKTMVDLGQADSYGEDLLGLMLTENLAEEESSCLTVAQIVEECNLFFFAGHETSASHLSWTMFLLALNPSWQERARAEVFEVCKAEFPDADSLNKLRILGMVMNESLRLYPPVPFITREASKDMQLADLFLPKGLNIVIPILMLQHDKELWGEDADEFNPERFSEGVTKACKHPSAFLPFSFGPRNCVGQTFALMESRVVLAMVLQRLRFRLSPSYRHAPSLAFTLQPKHGVQLIMERI